MFHYDAKRLLTLGTVSSLILQLPIHFSLEKFITDLLFVDILVELNTGEVTQNGKV